jgi:hypothetical protein
MKMIVRMISREITIPHHPTHAGGGGHGVGGQGIVMIPETILTTISILNSLHELKFTCVFYALTNSLETYLEQVLSIEIHVNHKCQISNAPRLQGLRTSKKNKISSWGPDTPRHTRG